MADSVPASSPPAAAEASTPAATATPSPAAVEVAATTTTTTTTTTPAPAAVPAPTTSAPVASAAAPPAAASGASTVSGEAGATSTSTPATSGARRYDVIVFGATGFTGGLVCEYLASRGLRSSDGSADIPLRWAIAGRNKDKLDAVKKSITTINPARSDVDVLVVDATQESSLSPIVIQTRVVLSTAGPFALIGEPLVASCAHLGTDYCDITGEVQWVRLMIDKYEAAALTSGARIISCCGFDSLPADLGVLMLVDHVRTTLGQGTRSVNAVVSVAGSASGGTISSMLNIFSLPKKELLPLANPFLLTPSRKRTVQDGKGVAPRRAEDKSQAFVRYDKDRKAWTIPFVMAACNEKIVRRSHSLVQAENNDEGFGTEFSYRESMKAKNLFVALMMLIGLALFGLLCVFPVTRKWVGRVAGQSGSGPTREKRAKSKFAYDLVARSTAGVLVRGSVRGGDPGYTETAKMLSECGIALATDSIRARLPKRAGFLTPATGLGLPLVERLNAVGIRFELATDKKTT